MKKRAKGNKKNVIEGNLTHVRSVIIGDRTIIHQSVVMPLPSTVMPMPSAVMPLPRELTVSIPRIHPDELIGREDDLLGLHDLLHTQKRAVVVNGLGGIGKTTLAQAYLSRYYDEYHHIIWITQGSEELSGDFIDADGLIRNLAVETGGLTASQLFDEIMRKLKAIGPSPNLLIVDNANQSIKKYLDRLPGQPHWHLLVTSRETIGGLHLFPIGFLEEDQAVALFKKHYPYHVISDDEIRELIKIVEYHTLTIEILAKTAAVERYDLATLKDAIDKDVRADVEVAHNRRAESIGQVGTYLQAMFTLSRLEVYDIWLLKQFICLPPGFHPFQQLQELIILKNDEFTSFLGEILATLVQKGWLLHNVPTDSYKMHRIIAAVVKKEVTIGFDDIQGLVISLHRKLYADPAINYSLDKFEWVPYARTLLSNLQDDVAGKNIATLQDNLALCLRDMGDYAAARSLLEQSIRTTEALLGKDHAVTAARYGNLGLVIRDLGDYPAARSLMEESLRIYEKIGGTPIALAHIYSNLGLVLLNLGEIAQARSLLEKAIPMLENEYGKDHPITVTGYTNLAMTLEKLEDYTGARTLLEKALQFCEKNLGPDHPQTAHVYANLAVVLQRLKDHAGARMWLEKALRSEEKSLGPDHPNVVALSSNLAVVLQDLDDVAGGRSLLEKALGYYEKNLGPDHPSTANVAANLAIALYRLGDIHGALEASKRSYLSYKKVLPEGHPDIKRTQEIYEFIKEKVK